MSDVPVQCDIINCSEQLGQSLTIILPVFPDSEDILPYLDEEEQLRVVPYMVL